MSEYVDSLPEYAQFIICLCMLSYMIVIISLASVTRDIGKENILWHRAIVALIFSPITVIFMLGEYIHYLITTKK